MKRNYTNVGLSEYSQLEINRAISGVKWEPFRRDDLPFSQGECIKTVVQECNIPVYKIIRMSLHGAIRARHGFYALEVQYGNGLAHIYIADNGCSACVVCSDFYEGKKLADSV